MENQFSTDEREKYIKEKMCLAELNGGKNSRPLDKQERKLLGRLTGQINWAATQSRPDIVYSVMELSNKFNKGCFEDLKKAKRTIVKLSSNPMKVLFPKMVFLIL